MKVSYLFNGLEFTSGTNTRFVWIVRDCISATNGMYLVGKNRDGSRLTRTAPYKKSRPTVCLARDGESESDR